MKTKELSNEAKAKMKAKYKKTKVVTAKPQVKSKVKPLKTKELSDKAKRKIEIKFLACNRCKLLKAKIFTGGKAWCLACLDIHLNLESKQVKSQTTEKKQVKEVPKEITPQVIETKEFIQLRHCDSCNKSKRIKDLQENTKGMKIAVCEPCMDSIQKIALKPNILEQLLQRNNTLAEFFAGMV